MEKVPSSQRSKQLWQPAHVDWCPVLTNALGSERASAAGGDGAATGPLVGLAARGGASVAVLVGVAAVGARDGVALQSVVADVGDDAHGILPLREGVGPLELESGVLLELDSVVDGGGHGERGKEDGENGGELHVCGYVKMVVIG